MKDLILSEAKKLHELGFAIHWLHPKSKRPVESGWTSGPRAEWDYLKETYQKGMNVGVRLGNASKVRNNYLGVVDVDVKSKDKAHRVEVAKEIKRLTGAKELPVVISGRGNGSRHYYVLTPEPLTPFKAAQSKDIVKVSMPSVRPSKKELAQLSQKELEQGLRLRPAWEIGIMGEGQQVVLPPSIHPDSGRNYAWQHTFDSKRARNFNSKVLESIKPVEKSVGVVENSKAPSNSKAESFSFEVAPVELSWLPIHDNIRDMILTGKNVEDRSATLLPVSSALLKAGLTRDEILTVLTEPEYYLSQTCYQHAQSSNRQRAARWLWRYTVKKVFEDNSAEKLFEVPITEPIELTFDEQTAEEEAFEDSKPWTDDLDMTDKGVYRTTLRNVVMILQHAVGKDMVKRDLLAYRDFYSMDTAWGGEAEAALTDDDLTKIKHWISNRFGCEPSTNTIGEALTIIATKNAFDPAIDWIEALPEWDGVERLDTWLKDHFGATGNEEYLAQVFRKWICAMVLRINKPGAKFDWMPIFEGPQGAGKSSFGKILVGEKNFLDSLPPDLYNKDAALALQGMLAVEMSELTSFRKNEIEAVKAFLTRTVDKVRPPYGERWIESARRCVFFGTTNFDTYLKDDSGNRRFKPVKVGNLDFDQLEIDRDQLFAEAKYLLAHGFEMEKTLDITEDAKGYELQIQNEKMIADDSALMQQEILRFVQNELRKPAADRFNFKKFSMIELFETGPFLGTPPLKNWKYDTRNTMFAGKALKSLGGTKMKSNGLIVWKLGSLGDTVGAP